jgi:hypothetical protein
VPGPRKVRIFRDRKKSPNWYVEWRDREGRRHCESCGPRRKDAEERAHHIQEALRARRADASDIGTAVPPDEGECPDRPTALTSQEGIAVQLHGVLRCPQGDIPIDLFVQLKPDILEILKRLIADRKGA